MVKRVRVLLREIPLMLCSIIADAVIDQPDVELLSLDSPELLENGAVDVILTGAIDPHNFERAGSLLAEWPKSRILVLSSSGREAVMYEWYPRKFVLGDVSPRTLVRVIRGGPGLIC